MMFNTNLKMAVSSLKNAKIRSLLTMLGVAIGVSSVLVAVSVGLGVKNQVLKQVTQLGDDIITIIPGKTFTDDESGEIVGFNSSASQGASTLTEKDVASLKAIDGVGSVIPNSYITGSISSPEVSNYTRATIIGTTPQLKDMYVDKLEYGEFFNDKDVQKNVVVIGSNVANDVFNQRDPIGRIMTIRGTDYIVRGVLSAGPESPITFGFSYNNAVYMPQESANRLIGARGQINQIVVVAESPTQAQRIADESKAILLTNHANQEDFTVIQQRDFIKATDELFALLTSFVAAIAGISLFVGGVGIMNIMLVSVSERTREIGIRKAVGATNRQVVSQFLIEAILLSLIGGIIGILLSLAGAYFIKLYTPIVPVISIQAIAIAFGVSFVVGVIFGIAPAIKAASKDPIQALRQL